MKKIAVIVAGGSGNRMSNPVPKQFLKVNGRPLLFYTLTAFLDAFTDLRIILVLPKEHLETGEEIIQSTADCSRIVGIPGGSTRFESVRLGLAQVGEEAIVFVHDGVRCLVTRELIRHCYQIALEKGNAIPSVTAVDSIRLQTQIGYELVDRNKVRIIQTPQTFKSSILKAAYRQEYRESFTDEATVAESAGIPIHLVEGDPTNIKITLPLDLFIAEKILEERNRGNR